MACPVIAQCSLAILIALAATLPCRAAEPAPLSVQDLGGGRFELRTTLQGSTDPAIGQQAVMPTAVALCGNRHVQLGRYRWEAHQPLAGEAQDDASTRLDYTQLIECRDAPQATPIPATDIPPAPGEAPTALDEAHIRRLSLVYLEAVDTGDFDRAHASFSPGMRGYMTPEAWRTPRARFNAAASGDPSREVIRLTWYDDPEGAPQRGRYVAADYRAAYATGAAYCGYLIWLRQGDGGYLIARTEEGYITPDVASGVAPGDMGALRAQIGCRD